MPARRLAVLLASLLLLAGCGSTPTDSSQKPTENGGKTTTADAAPSSSSPESSKASSSAASASATADAGKAPAYKASAGVLCRTARRAASGDALAGSDAALAEKRLKAVLTKLRATKPSAAQTQQHAALLSAVSRMQEALMQAQAGRGDETRLRSELKTGQRELTRAARSLSLKCA